MVTPQAPAYVVRLVRRADASPASRYTLSLVVPAATGLRRVAFESVTLDQLPAVTFAADAPVKLTIVRVDGDAAVDGPAATAGADEPVVDPAPRVVGVKQLANADLVGCDEGNVPAGRVVAVLFSEEVTPDSVQDRRTAGEISAFLPDGNRALSVALQPGRRVAYVALRDPLGPFVPRTMTVSGASDRGGRALGAATLPMQATVSEQGAVLSGRVLTAEGTPVPDATVRLLYEFDCGNGLGAVGISERQTDAQGRFGWDYVPIGPAAVKLIAIDPQTNLPRTVRVSVSRAAQRLNVDIVFVGRGTVRGRTLDETGAPLALTAVRVTSLTDNSQFGTTTDDAGAFTVPRVPVGNVLIEAVNVQARAQTVVSDLVPFAGATVARDLTLFGQKTPEGVTIKYGVATGKVLRDVTLSIAPGVTVFAYYQNRSQTGVRCPSSASGEPPECPVAAAVPGEDGVFRFDQLPAGAYRVTAIDQGGLHAPNDEIRKQLIPWAQYTTIDALLGACQRWFEKTGREITLEYTLLRGVNDRPEHARQLADLSRTLRANVNLIRYNEVGGLAFQRPRDDDVREFQDILRSRHINVHIRASRGRDIAAACGQLRHEAAGSPGR